MRKIYHFKGDAAHPQMEATYVGSARQKLNRIKGSISFFTLIPKGGHRSFLNRLTSAPTRVGVFFVPIFIPK